MVSYFSRVWINRVWLPILLVVTAEQGKYFFPCTRLHLIIWSREPRQPAYSPNSG